MKLNKQLILEARTAPLKYSMTDLIDKFNHKDLSKPQTQADRETQEYNLRTGKNLSKGEYIGRRTNNLLDSPTVAELADMKREAARKEKEKLKSTKNVDKLIPKDHH